MLQRNPCNGTTGWQVLAPGFAWRLRGVPARCALSILLLVSRSCAAGAGLGLVSVRVALGPGWFWFLLCVVVAFFCFGWCMLQQGFSRLWLVLCRPVLLGRLCECAFWFPACVPPSSTPPPFFVSLCNTHNRMEYNAARFQKQSHYNL
jgi:hypothetical protein